MKIFEELESHKADSFPYRRMRNLNCETNVDQVTLPLDEGTPKENGRFEIIVAITGVETA